MLGNNKISSILTKNPESQNKIKHIEVIYYHVKEFIKEGELAVN